MTINSKLYLDALTWFVRNKYEMKSTILKAEKNEQQKVKVELFKDGILQKTAFVNYDINFHTEIKSKIINLYNHFNNAVPFDNK